MALTRRFLIGGLVLGVAAGSALLVAPRGLWTGASVTMTPPEVQAAVSAGKLLLVDIRRPDEWARTGVAVSATPIDMRREDFLPALQAVMAQSPERPVALICAGGVRSRYLAAQLAQAGIANVVDVPEGMMGSVAGPGWIRRGLPVVAYPQG